MTSANMSNWISTMLNFRRRMVKTLCFGWRRRVTRGLLQPLQVTVQQVPQLPAAGDQEAIDRDLRGRQKLRRRKHRLLERKRLDPREAREHCAGLVRQHRFRVRVG